MIPASNFELMAVKSGTDLAIRAGGFGADVVGNNRRFCQASDASQSDMLPSPALRKPRSLPIQPENTTGTLGSRGSKQFTEPQHSPDADAWPRSGLRAVLVAGSGLRQSAVAPQRSSGGCLLLNGTLGSVVGFIDNVIREAAPLQLSRSLQPGINACR